LDGNETNLDDDIETLSSDAWSSSTCHEMEDAYLPSSHSQSHSKNRYTFDHSMYDCLEWVIIIKVFSHQLNSDFTVKTLGEKSKPNIFAVLANQIADNAASQAHNLFLMYTMNNLDKCLYPPFSSRWRFSFGGCLSTKGTAKRLYEKIDEELIQSQQHRTKQGLFLRMLP
jgi:hypothetical protein